MIKRIAGVSSALTGVGIHSGAASSIQLRPLQPGMRGIWLEYQPKDKNTPTLVPFSASRVEGTQLRTRVGGVDTVEHLLSALWGMNVAQGVASMLQGTEVPIMDGSALDFVHCIEQTPLQESRDSRPLLTVKEKLLIQSNQDPEARVEILPAYRGRKSLQIDVECVFDGVGEKMTFERNWESVQESIDVFVKDIAPARTFVSLRDVDKMREAGLGLGGNESNCVVIDPVKNEPVNTMFRFGDERVRHKMLDILGDFSLLGNVRLCGTIRAVRPGHSLNHSAVMALLQDNRLISVDL